MVLCQMGQSYMQIIVLVFLPYAQCTEDPVEAMLHCWLPDSAPFFLLIEHLDKMGNEEEVAVDTML